MAPTHDRRQWLGGQVRRTRARLGYSVEAAATRGGIGHMTWRRIERGDPVNDRSYFAVDKAFDWPSGRTLEVAEAEEQADGMTLEPAAGVTSAPPDTVVGYSSPVEVDGGISVLSEAFRRVIDDTQNLSLGELKALHRSISAQIELHQDTVSEIRDYLAKIPDLRPHVWNYSRETSRDVAARYTEASHRYNELWNRINHLAQDFEEKIAHHGKQQDLTDFYTSIVPMVNRLMQSSNALSAAQDEAARDHALQQKNRETEEQ